MVERTDLYGNNVRMAAIMAGGGTWAVVGLSNNKSRAAYGVAQFLESRGVHVVPIHPSAQPVHGLPAFPDLRTAARAVGRIDVVDVFLRSELVGPVVDDAIAIGAAAVWMQLSVVDENAAARARAAGLLTVMDACPAQQWDRLVPAFLAGRIDELAEPVGVAEPAGQPGVDLWGSDPMEAGEAMREVAGAGEACAWAPPPTNRARVVSPLEPGRGGTAEPA